MIRLSICIATRNRSDFLLETVNCILGQVNNEVEIIIVDGASSDGSKEKIEAINTSSTMLKYFYEDHNSGVDRDFDKSVEYASGEYCWLFSDDDLLMPNAISSVINALKTDPEFLIVNSSIHTKYFENTLAEKALKFDSDRVYNCQAEQAFLDLGAYLSFIGAIVVKRSFWLARHRKVYHGSAFAHLGVLFQAPLPTQIKFLNSPLIKIRYGNSDWAPRGFKIWTQQWPNLVMMLENLPYKLRKKVANNKPLELFKFCILYRGMGLYSLDIYKKSVQGNHSKFTDLILKLISVIPVKLLNILLVLIFLKKDSSLVNVYRLSSSPAASKASRWAFFKFGIEASDKVKSKPFNRQ
jgi:abequosyltransferase